MATELSRQPRGAAVNAMSWRDERDGGIQRSATRWLSRARDPRNHVGVTIGGAERMNVHGVLLAVFVGALLPLQALLNARLGQLTHGALFASLASFAVGSVALLALWLVARPAGGQAGVGQVPWWLWSGGLIGAAFVVSATTLVPRLGAASLICLVILGQLAGSLLLDHYGVLHARQPIDPMRLLGLLLVAAGAALVVRPWQHG